jgi:TolB-like protein
MSFFEELKRRNVFRVGLAYVVAAWLLLQIADVLVPMLNLPEAAGRFVLLLLVIGFLPVLIFSWAFEVTPEGIKRESEVVRSESITRETAARLNKITIGLLIAAVAVVGLDRLIPEKGSEPFSQQPAQSLDANQEKRDLAPAEAESPQADPAEKSVAVLPFVNMSSDPEQEFFSDGISEEILNVLTRIPNLKVAARTSSFQFKGQTLDIADIARQLKVNHVLEGSVRKAGNQIRITAQLIEAESGYHLWSDTFDRELENVFAIQDEIAGAIATELKTRLAGEALHGSQPVAMEAYELYLKGRSLVATRRKENLLEAIGILESAIELEPGYAAAMATLSKAHMVLPWFSRETHAGESREKAREWASRALELDPRNSEALSTMGIVFSESDMNPEAALELLRKAVEENPGSVAANNFLGDVAFRTGDMEAALLYESRAAELDPLGPIQLTDLANVYWMMGDYEKVREMANRALELDPEFDHAITHLIDTAFVQGRLQDLENLNQRFTSGDGWEPNARGWFGLDLMLHHAKAEHEQARSRLEEMTRQVKAGELSPVSVALAAVGIGEFDAAGTLLLQALEQNDGTWTYPGYIRLPEQAPGSEPWQEFWRQPGPARFAEIRRAHGMDPHAPGYGEAAQK